MAVPTCTACVSHAFEAVPFTPVGREFKLTMVQCAACGAPVGVLDPGAEVAAARLAAQVAAIDERLRRIVAALNR